MLQEKMLKFRRTRAAWHRRFLLQIFLFKNLNLLNILLLYFDRYHQKSDPDILRQQYQAVKLNIPLPAIREKTFVLKTRAERKLKSKNLIQLIIHNYKQISRKQLPLLGTNLIRWNGNNYASIFIGRIVLLKLFQIYQKPIKISSNQMKKTTVHHQLHLLTLHLTVIVHL